MNIISLMGRITADPELRETQSKISYVKFSLAVKKYSKKDDADDVDFINCVAWRTTAEFLSKYFKKGDMIAVTGTLHSNSFEVKGEKRYSSEVEVREVYFTGNGKRNN